MANEVTIGFRGTPEYRRQIQQAALDRGMKVQDLIETALYQFMHGSGSTTTAQPPGYQSISIRKEMVPVVMALVGWIENEGKDAVLAALSKPAVAAVESESDAPALPKSARKLRPA